MARPYAVVSALTNGLLSYPRTNPEPAKKHRISFQPAVMSTGYPYQPTLGSGSAEPGVTPILTIPKGHRTHPRHRTVRNAPMREEMAGLCAEVGGGRINLPVLRHPDDDQDLDGPGSALATSGS